MWLDSYLWNIAVDLPVGGYNANTFRTDKVSIQL